MSYKLETKWTSPNSTPGNKVLATFGRPRTIEAIAIHWWGDPKAKPVYENIVSFLCSPSSGVSAHFVATGTKRRAAQLVNFADASWATNSANPYTISIECDPRARKEDYDVVAELIAQLRQVFGNLPLVPHNKYVATACPGVYDLKRLDREARQKIAKPSWKWGHVEDKVKPKPDPKPKPTDNLYRLTIDGKQVAAYSSAKNAYSGYLYYNKGVITHKGKNVTKTVVDKYKPKPPVKPTPETPPKVPESPPTVSLDESSTTLLQDVKRLLQELTQLLKNIFKQGDK